MLTVFDPFARIALHERVDRLSPEHDRRWGSMHVEQMVCHAADQLRVAPLDVFLGRKASAAGVTAPRPAIGAVVRLALEMPAVMGPQDRLTGT